MRITICELRPELRRGIGLELAWNWLWNWPLGPADGTTFVLAFVRQSVLQCHTQGSVQLRQSYVGVRGTWMILA